MGILIRRPNASASSGSLTSVRADLVDGDDATFRSISTSSMFLWVYNNMLISQIPSGRKPFAVRVAHRISHGGSYNGWPEAYLRYGGVRITNSRLFLPGQSLPNWTTQKGPAIYKSGYAQWTEAELNQFGSDHDRITFDGKSWYRIADHWMEVIYDEPLTAVPTAPFPANSQTIATSTVSFSATAPAPQEEQLVRVVFQVARNNTFTNDPRTFNSAYHGRTGANEKAFYTSVVNTASDTNLGPGQWYMRMKTQDIIGNETGWSTTTSFTITHAALPAPENIAPAPQAISATPYGVRTSRTLTAASDSRQVGMEWQFSPVQTFASGVVTWKNIVDRVTTGSVSYNAQPVSGLTPGLNGGAVSTGDPSQYLIQGVWFMRSRTVDKWDQNSPWSEITTFTVSHQPQAQNITPSSNQVIDQQVTPVRWTFGDPWSGDQQTAYQIKVFNSSDVMIHDTGKINSTSLQHFLNINESNLYLNLRYTINLWDLDNVTPVQVSSNNFVLSKSPVIVQSYPAQNELVLTGQPTFVWDPGIGRPGTIQQSFELRVFRQSDNVQVYTTGVVVSTATSHTPPRVILRNGTAYRETLRIVDSDGLTSTLSRDFTASYQAPPDPIFTVDVDSYQQNGYVQLDWSTMVADDFFIQWKVYRRKLEAEEWDLIAEIDDAAIKYFHDWMVPSVDYYEYAVTQLADRSGFILESALPETPPSYFVASDDYWLIHPTDESKNVRLYSVTDDSYEDEIEYNDYIVKGRGRRVNYGTVIGKSGSLSVKLRTNSSLTAREQSRVLREIRTELGWVLMRDPFGNITKVALGNIKVSRIAGVGLSEFVDADIPYMEVF